MKQYRSVQYTMLMYPQLASGQQQIFAEPFYHEGLLLNQSINVSSTLSKPFARCHFVTNVPSSMSSYRVPSLLNPHSFSSALTISNIPSTSQLLFAFLSYHTISYDHNLKSFPVEFELFLCLKITKTVI